MRVTGFDVLLCLPGMLRINKGLNWQTEPPTLVLTSFFLVYTNVGRCKMVVVQDLYKYERASEHKRLCSPER